jgi:hypothetical protein
LCSDAERERKKMSFIDWSDSEGMFDLLIEFIRDEMNYGDAQRQEFLAHLLTTLSTINDATVEDVFKKLEVIQDSVDEEFMTDPAFLHINDFINELERIK